MGRECNWVGGDYRGGGCGDLGMLGAVGRVGVAVGVGVIFLGTGAVGVAICAIFFGNGRGRGRQQKNSDRDRGRRSRSADIFERTVAVAPEFQGCDRGPVDRRQNLLTYNSVRHVDWGLVPPIAFITAFHT